MAVLYVFLSDKAMWSKNNFKASPPCKTQTTEGLLLLLQIEEFGRWITSFQPPKYLFLALNHLLRAWFKFHFFPPALECGMSVFCAPTALSPPSLFVDKALRT